MRKHSHRPRARHENENILKAFCRDWIRPMEEESGEPQDRPNRHSSSSLFQVRDIFRNLSLQPADLLDRAMVHARRKKPMFIK
jgi:hypothetical protein